MQNTPRLLVVLLAGVLLSPACGAGGTDGASGPEVLVSMFAFGPSELTVTGGSTVTWTNQDEIEHTVTDGTPDRRGRFDHVFTAEPGGTFSFTYDEPGTYPYFCDRHRFMRGVIEVT